MKYILPFLFLVGCSKVELTESNQNLQARPLAPQNPIAPQVTVANPQPFAIVGDTFHLKFSARSGQTWYYTPDQLVKYKVFYDLKVIDSANLNSKSFSKQMTVTTGSSGQHSIDIIFYSKGGYTGSQGFYIKKY